jgi:restriction system protein
MSEVARMNFRMAENSLFAILLRKPWWVSALVAVGLLAFTRFGLPPAWFLFAAPIALPFIVIAGITGWRALQRPSASRVAAVEEAARAMGWPEFATEVEAAWIRDGWTVSRDAGPGADFSASQGWKRAAIACKRWKVARTGVEPLRELAAARERLEAHEGLYVTVGEVSEQAVRFAAANRIRIVDGAELAKRMPALGRGGSLRVGSRSTGRPGA